MTKETRSYLIRTCDRFNNELDEAFAIVPEGTKSIAIGQLILFSIRKTLIFLVTRSSDGKLQKKLLKESEKGKELHVAQAIVEKGNLVVYIDAGEGYAKLHSMEKITIPMKS